MKIRTSLLKSTLADCFKIYKNTYVFRPVIPLWGIYLMKKTHKGRKLLFTIAELQNKNESKIP